jgi:stringent starvation protein B
VKSGATTPYLIRAIYEWCVDHGHTPYIAVRVNERTRVPVEHVRNGEIILNVSADATRDLTIGNELIQFSARFSGLSRELSIPIDCVSGVFAKETGQGLAFQLSPDIPVVDGGATETPPDKPTSPPSGGGRPKLSVVK